MMRSPGWKRVTPAPVRTTSPAPSMPSALALPAFPARDTLVVGTYAVVVFSLLVQAPTLGWALRRLGIGAHPERADRPAGGR
jgi:NhaP-type Na+/H+ or K+/H+ antiporter